MTITLENASPRFLNINNSIIIRDPEGVSVRIPPARDHDAVAGNYPKPVENWLLTVFVNWLAKGNVMPDADMGMTGVTTLEMFVDMAWDGVFHVGGNAAPEFFQGYDSIQPDQSVWDFIMAQLPGATKQDKIILLDFALDGSSPTLTGVIDYLRMVSERRNDLSRISVPDAIRSSQLWHDQLTKRKMKDLPELVEGEDYDVMDREGEFEFWYLKSDRALKHEGLLMRHCLGTFADQFKHVEYGTSYISVRKESVPFATMEVKDHDVIQCQGKCNGLIDDEARVPIIMFMTRRDLHLGSGHNLGM